MNELTPKLPVPVLQEPHWRVNVRPADYICDRVGTLAECLDVLRHAQVRLGGWEYPYLSPDPQEQSWGNSWIEGWAEFGGQSEYWRFYQSGQFLHLLGVEEATNARWRTHLADLTRRRVFVAPGVDFSAVPGFISITRLLYTVTGVFEFAARLAERGVLGDSCTVAINLRGVKGFLLTVGDADRFFRRYREAGQDDLGREWKCEKQALLAESAELALAASRWFYERFGWMEPGMDILKRDQENFLAGRM
jgi:hypothetical protein